MEKREQPIPSSERKTEQKILTSAEIGSQFSAQLQLAEMMGWKDFVSWTGKYASLFEK